MGLGDWIMASAAAEHVPEGRRAVFGDGVTAYWSDAWENNPKIAGTAGRDTVWIPDFPGHRPYVAAFVKRERYLFKEDFRAPYGKIHLSHQERDWAAQRIKGDYIVVEPHVVTNKPGLKLGYNKAWDKWPELFKLDYPWLQLGEGEALTRQIRTNSIRKAFALLANAKLLVTTDGALHHAAAALGVPAIVLWGGVVSPKILGYPTHINVWNGAKPCGTFAHVCPHCREAMESISVDQVKKYL